MVAIYFKYQTPVHDYIFDRTPAETEDFYYRYFDYVESATGQK